MNNSAAKVGEIFTEAGAAFNKLAEMIMLLHPIAETTPSVQAKTPVKQKATDEKYAPSTSGQHTVHTSISQQVTLNMLNAPEPEMEVESLGGDVKLEFEPSTEEIVT